MMRRLRQTSRSTRLAACALAALALTAGRPWRLLAQAPEPAKGIKYQAISATDLKEWLTYLSSDELTGRQIFTEGYGLAAQYVADHLQAWGVKPLGDHGSYLQAVRLKGYKVTRHSTVEIAANGQRARFTHGEHVTFAANSGGPQTLSFSGIEFVGYGDGADLQGRTLKDKLVVMVPHLSTPAAGGFGGRGGRFGAASSALGLGAKAVITYVPPPAAPTPAEQALANAQAALAQATDAVQQAQQDLRGAGAGGRGAAGRGGRGGVALPPADLTTVQSVLTLVPPQVTGDDTLFAALFAGGPVTFADVKAKAMSGAALSPMSLPASVTITIDNTFEVVSEQIAHNVVGMVEGTDPKLKDSYVMFGAHLDHIGYSVTGNGRGPSPDGCRRRGQAALDALAKAGKTPQSAGRGARGAVPAPTTPVAFDDRDNIYNGADDDGSGSTAELGIAKAFATGPKPRRSVVFVWHTGEEAGLYGSLYNADFPVVPLDKVQVQLNTDMIGRDDCNDVEGDYSNSVFIVGDDRISTDLHNLIVETNTGLSQPLTLDYELNDPADPESVYTRSDHYSYAAKGIPIAFFTTGLHPDYHRVSDSVEKILFPKMARIAQLMYETGFSAANTDRVLERDNRGPRTGFGSKAEIIKK